LAEYSVQPSEFSAAAELFFENLAEFLRLFAERADQFSENASQEVAELAQVIGNTVSGIGNAVQPLVDILEYCPEVTDIEARFEHFFYHLGMALYYIEEAAGKWQVSEAAQTFSEAVSQVVGNLGSAVDFLVECAEYGTDHSAFALLGFQHFIEDLGGILDIIATASGTLSASLDLARDFAADCAEVLSNIRQGIEQLNALSGLGVEPYNLVEAGQLLIRSLADGFETEHMVVYERVRDVLAVVFNGLNDWLASAVYSSLWRTGEFIGQALVVGMIAGVNARASELYQAVQAVVEGAIAAAEAAAGASSYSKVMWQLGREMAEGLQLGFAENLSGFDVMVGQALGVAGGRVVTTVPMAVPTPTQTLRTEEVHYHLEVTLPPGTPVGSIQQQFEDLEFYRRFERR